MSKNRNEYHAAAIESDRRGFFPRSFTSIGSAKQKQQILKQKTLFEPYGLYDFDLESGGADVSPLSN